VGFWRLNWGRITFFGVVIAAIVIGVLIGGGTGYTITAIAGGLLAMSLLVVGGIGPSSRENAARRFGNPLDDEDERDPRD
jgi:hypothetical protein